MSWETQTAGRVLRELYQATKTWEHFGDLAGPMEGDAKRRWRRLTGKSSDVNFVLLQEVVIEGEKVAANEECGSDECEGGVWERAGSLSDREVLKREAD